MDTESADEIVEHNAETGETIIRKMTPQEIAALPTEKDNRAE